MSRTPVLVLVLVVLVVLVVLAGAEEGEDEIHPELRAAGGRRQGRGRAHELTAHYWYEEARRALDARARRLPAAPPARNVVMFLGDGMSVPTLAAARTLLGQRQNQSGEEAQLSFESFPALGLIKTYCVNAQVPDSACTATAYLCGVKANYGTLGVTASVPRRDCAASLDPEAQLESIAAWALADGRDAGIVTTTRITHASPAGAYAHAADRGWESDADVRNGSVDPLVCPDIAHQLVHHEPGKHFRVILGGGRREFIPTTEVDEEGTAGRRTDGRNLIEEWRAQRAAQNVSHQYVWSREELLAANASLPEYLLGLFEGTHLKYHMRANATAEPTLAELTEVAIRMLSRNQKGFFLFVEGGRIDHAHHNNRVELALDETIEFSSAVARAVELLPEEDSLLVVTADHAHVMSFNGYAVRGSDVLGASAERDSDGVPYQTLSYTNGPGKRNQVEGRRVDVTLESRYRAPFWRSHVEVPLASETHGADDVAVFARGPHAGLLAGLYEQSQLPHAMARAACLGPGAVACSLAPRLAPPAISLLILVMYFFSK